jgi:hypothetical protein
MPHIFAERKYKPIKMFDLDSCSGRKSSCHVKWGPNCEPMRRFRSIVQTPSQSQAPAWERTVPKFGFGDPSEAELRTRHSQAEFRNEEEDLPVRSRPGYFPASK